MGAEGGGEDAEEVAVLAEDDGLGARVCCAKVE